MRMREIVGSNMATYKTRIEDSHSSDLWYINHIVHLSESHNPPKVCTAPSPAAVLYLNSPKLQHSPQTANSKQQPATMQLTVATVALAALFAAAAAAPQPQIYIHPGGICVPGGIAVCFPGTQCARPFDLPFGPYVSSI